MSTAQVLPFPTDDGNFHLDHAFDMMLLLDRGNVVVRANAAVREVLGCAPHDLLGTLCTALLHPDDGAPFAALLEAVRAGQACRDQELRWFRRDGALVWLALSARAGAEGTVLASLHDVTDHRQARDELKRSQERLNAMLDSIGDAFFAVDRDWRLTYANRKAADFVGVELDASVGRHVLDVAPALIGSEALDHYRAAMATGEPRSAEIWWAPLGIWLEIRVYPSGDGLSVYFHDITQKRQAEDAVRKSEQRFRNLFQAAGDSIMIVDAALRVVAVNERACACFGYTEQEFLGRPVAEVDGGFPYDRAMLERLRAGGTHLLRIEKRRKDGSTFPAEVQVSLFEDGGQDYFQAIVRDLTGRHEAERQLRESERRFRDMIAMTPSGYLLADFNSRVLDVNPALCALVGREPQELIGSPLSDLFVDCPCTAWKRCCAMRKGGMCTCCSTAACGAARTAGRKASRA